MTKKNHEIGFSFDELFNHKSCEHETELSLYFENRLPEKSHKAFEDHLKECATCSKQLLDLQEAQQTAERTTLDDTKADLIFKRTHLKLQEYLAKKYEKSLSDKTKLAAPFSKLLGFFSFPAYANAAIALLLLVLTYPAYKGFILDRRLAQVENELASVRSQSKDALETLEIQQKSYEQQIRNLREGSLAPQLSSSEIRSIRPERFGKVETLEVNFGEHETSFNLLLSVQALDYEAYLVQITKNKSVIWESEIKPRKDKTSSSALISLTLRKSYLKKGEYRLLIYGKSAKRTVQVEEYILKISGHTDE